MSRHISPRTWLVAALAAAIHAGDASAQLSLFRTALQAQQHCPNDSVVWIDARKRIYYVDGQRLYSQGGTGTFVCRKEARRSGYRRSLFGRR
jgi:nitrous oxide reductase accessory protein NosL